jgi:predicted MFS family arabinose efflux permease
LPADFHGILALTFHDEGEMRLRFQLFVFMLLRTIFNTMHRMVYPFLAVFARGLGVDVTALSLALTGRSLIGVFVPFISSVADHRGRKFGMLAGIVLFTLGVGLVALHPTLWTLTLALILALLGKYLFDPAMQAYLGDRIVYEKRGLALALTEMGWSMSFVVGIPLIGWLIARYGWVAPFPLLGILGVGMFGVIALMIPSLDAHHEPAAHPWANFRLVLTSAPAIAGISIAMWASAANELVNLIFGVWLEDSFHLQIMALGAASAVIGFAELSGEGLVAMLTDRLGKPRALAIGLSGNALASLLLPWLGRTQSGALVGLFLFYITFEYVMVSHVPMMTETLPAARATVMSFNLTGHSLGRAIGALLATFIYRQFGFAVIAVAAMVLNLWALLALRQLVRGAPALRRSAAG